MASLKILVKNPFMLRTSSKICILLIQHVYQQSCKHQFHAQNIKQNLHSFDKVDPLLPCFTKNSRNFYKYV